MDAFFIWLLKTVICSGVMFGYYQMFLKDKTFHHYNRFYLLFTVVVSLLLPLLKIDYFTLEVNNDIYLIINKLQNFNSTKTLNNDYFYFNLISAFFGLVAFVFLMRFLWSVLKIQQFKKQFPKENYEGISFYQTNLQDAPFSFFRNLFWKDSILINSDLGRQILKHEMVHVEQKHSYDKILLEIVCALFWFNPFFYLIRKEISLIHEYLADKKALKNSDTKAFAQMLLSTGFSGNVLPGTSPFLSSNLKKRLIMLKKSKTKYAYARKILVLPVLFTMGFIYLVNAKNKEIRQTNEAISEMVNTQKITAKLQDTLKPKTVEEIQQKIENIRKEIGPASDAINSKSAEIQKLGAEMQKKSDALRKLTDKKDFDNPQFEKLSQEMDVLGKKMDDIYNSPEMKANWEKMDAKYLEMDKLFAELDHFFKSDDFKNGFKENEAVLNKFNSAEFQKKIADVETQAKLAAGKAKFAEKAAKDAEKMVTSPEFQKKIDEAQKRAEEASKRAAEAATKADAAYKLLNNAPKFEKAIVMSPNPEKPKIFLNEKEYSGDINSVDPKNIDGINVKKNGNSKEIWIYTKDSPVKFKSGPQKFSFKEDVYDEIYINGKLSTVKELNSLMSDEIKGINIDKKNTEGKRYNVIKVTTK